MNQQGARTLRFRKTRSPLMRIDIHPNCVHRKQFAAVPHLRLAELRLCDIVVGISCYQPLLFGIVRCKNEVGESFHVRLGRIVLCLFNGIFCRVLGTEGFFFFFCPKSVHNVPPEDWRRLRKSKWRLKIVS